MDKEFKNIEHKVIYKKLINGLEKRSEIQNQAPSFDHSDHLSNHFTELDKYINNMLKLRENFAYRYLHSQRKFIGPLIVFGKKIIRKLLKWYIEPVAYQQTEFNNNVTSSIGRITQVIVPLNNQMKSTKQVQHSFEASIHNLEEKTEILTKMIQQQANVVEEFEKQKNELENQINCIEKQNSIYVERLVQAEEIIEKLNVSNLFNNDHDSFFNKKTFAQSGEDSILAYIIHVLGIPFDQVNYIDLGANHAKEMSNTFFFYNKGSQGVLVEANPELIPELKFHRHRDIVLNKLVDTSSNNKIEFYILSGDGLSTPDKDSISKIREINPNIEIVDTKLVETISYNDIVENYLGKSPTILSIDIEGKDIEIIRSIDFDKYRPVLIVIEMISYDVFLNYQTKNSEVYNFLKSKDYEEYAFTGINSIFIDHIYLNNARRK
ncbi:FkbM family methyltransferase [Paenibacillus sp. 276b]|uniref:FkbM family methyltransferase n=1 Tax=Paenibacillus sp. 276b TaxID=1566277 RepID=UPI00089D69D9|nr:FkbM family methyltransferase [Paenibacillus sp. 276b]SEB28289.1 methyltransferase, FkbM family [Paenibacillus sp. 276b]